MGIYQVKIKGKEGMGGYDTSLSESVENAIKEHQPKEIEQVKLLLAEDDPGKAFERIENELEETFRDLRDLADTGVTIVNAERNVWTIHAFMNSIKERVERIYSLLSALSHLEQYKEDKAGT